MLADEPADRYPDVTALLVDLTALERAAAGPERRPTPAWRRLAAPLVLVVAFALAVGVGSWPLQGFGQYDPSQATHVRLTDLPGKEWFPSLTPDGRFLVYARKTGDRSRLFLRQVGGHTDIDLLPNSPEGDSQPAVSAKGQIAFRSEHEGGGIFVMGLMGESVRRVTDFGFNPAWSPDGKEILFATEGIENPRIRRHPSKIYRVDVTTGERRLVHEGDAVQPSWSPHGFRIAYWSGFSPSGERVIWTVPADGGEAVQVTTGENLDWNPVWSPDGRHLYFASDRSGITTLWRVPIDERSGRADKPEPVIISGSMLLSFSADGRRIAYASDETRTILEKTAFKPESGAIESSAEAIAQTSNLIVTIDASRDGRWLVYQTSVPQEDLFVVHPDGTGLRQLTNDRFKDRQPRWSPDGTRIAFYSNRGGTYEIWTIRADGSQLERAAVFDGGRPAFHPIWSPHRRWIACDLGDNEALIDLARPAAERRPQLLPPPGHGMGFSASSWSADGRWLAGALHREERQLPGIVLYSLTGRHYVKITERGQSATWLSDSRHLLYWDSGKFFLLDTVSRVSRLVLTTPPGSDYNDFSLSPDDRFLYLARNTEQGDIWLLTLK